MAIKTKLGSYIYCHSQVSDIFCCEQMLLLLSACTHTHTQLLAKPQLEKKTSTMTLKNEIVHSAIIRFPLLLCRNNKCNRSHMHGISDQEIIKTHFHPQMKNCNDPRCGRWWAAALKVITEIKRSHTHTHTSAENQNASEALQLSKTFIMSLPTCKSACGSKWQQGKGANRWKSEVHHQME